MKKIFFCILVLLTSCQVNHYAKDKPKKNKWIEIDLGGITNALVTPAKFQYDRHSYIMFSCSNDCSTILHDPDCSCHNITNESDISRIND